MRLAAVYLPDNSIPYVFGEGHTGQTLNLGGKFEYSFEETKNSITLTSKELNKNFVDNFWGDDISLITSVVGRNGVGKTSLLRAINHSPDTKHKNSVLIFEYKNENALGILNETKKELRIELNNAIIDVTERDFERQYYSPVLDYDLVDTLSSIALVSYNDDRLEDYFLDSITRNALLLSDPVIGSLIEVYDDFPYYDQYLIGAKKNRKSHFRQVYLESNLGNPNRGDVLINKLNGEIQELEKLKLPREYDHNALIEIYKRNISFLKSESFTSWFEDIWSLPEYSCSNDYNYIHNSDDFIKNIEVTLLSYLILGAVFPQTGLGQGRAFDFNEITNSQNFSERINKLLEWYLISEHYDLYNSIKEKVSPFLASEKDKIISIIKEDRSPSNLRVDTGPIKERMIQYVEMFATVKDFYNFILQIINEEKLMTHKGELIFDIRVHKLETFNELVQKYKELLDVFQRIPTNVAILEFLPDKKLSSGEKALIDFYASLNTYIENIKQKKHRCLENYILLLDEPELGYHPLWKKKFVQAMVKTLPVIFSKITPLKYEDKSKKYLKTPKNIPNVQIIFSTHDPLTLSDIPKKNITYLDRPDEGFTEILDGNSISKRSFGANITDLLADSFFIEDGLIGDFAKEKINDTIKWLNYEKLSKEIPNWDKDRIVSKEEKDDKKEKFEYLRKEIQEWDEKKHITLINIIDEPVLKTKLIEMYSEINKEFDQEGDNESIIRNQIEKLAKDIGYEVKLNKKQK